MLANALAQREPADRVDVLRHRLRPRLQAIV